MVDCRTLDAGPEHHPAGRSLLAWIVGAMAMLGIGSLAWVLVDSMNPAADVPRSLYVTLEDIPAGARETILWRGVPIFIAHRTPDEIAAARADDGAEMAFPQFDADRVQRAEWLVVVGVETFRGWYELSGQQEGDHRGRWGGWAVTHEGIAYDTSGRLRRGRGGGNLAVPRYRFVSEGRIEIDWPIPKPEILMR